MKKTVLIFLYILSLNTVNSQLFTKEKVINNENFDKPSVSWGYYLGFNNYDFNFDYLENYDDLSSNGIPDIIFDRQTFIGNMKKSELT